MTHPLAAFARRTITAVPDSVPASVPGAAKTAAERAILAAEAPVLEKLMQTPGAKVD